MILTIKERFGVMGLLPDEANWATRRLIRDLVAKVGFSAEDHEQFGIRVDAERVQWNTDVEQEAEFELAGPEVKLIVEGLEKLDAGKKLTADHDSLCEKFLNTE